MQNVFFILSVFLLTSNMSFAGDFFSPPEPIKLAYENRSWVFVLKLDENRGRILFEYRVDGVIENTGTLHTEMYSELGPTAVLVDGTPLIAWVSTKTATSDDNVYFSHWKGASFSKINMAHHENDVPDMSPQLIERADGGAELVWYRNTGNDVVEKSVKFSSSGEILDKEDKAFPPPKSLRPSVRSFYSSISERWITDPIRCIAFGDSITYGLKRNSSGQTWNSDGYTGELRSYLGSVSPSPSVYKRGYPGDRSYNGVSRIDGVISDHSDANCILIMFGANDRYQGLSPNSTASNMRTMAEKARSRGIPPVMATITPNTKIGGIESYNSALRSMFSSQELTFADQYNKMISNGWPHSGDGLHVSDRGDGLMAQEWFRAMKTNNWIFPPIDHDGDGLSSASEGRNTDTDGDGIKNYLDPDDNNDGILTKDQISEDKDKDGIPDYIDMDINDIGWLPGVLLLLD